MKVSILLISYNHENYIADAVESILMQKNSFDTEIIFLDDCSTDNTFGSGSDKLSNIKNVTLIKNESNLGITKNYQKGFSLCSGEYVFVLEGDDYWIDTLKVQRQVEFLEEHPFHSMCFHPFIMQEGNSRIYKPYTLANNILNNSVYNTTYSINDLIAHEALIGTFSVCCYRKKWLNQLPDELFNVVAYDWAVNLFMGHFGLLGRLNETMGTYRLADNAQWSSKTNEERSTQIRSLISIYDELLDYQYTSLFANKLRMIDGDSQVNGQGFRLKNLYHRITRLLKV
ncbi:MAG: glycosyltransferase family 2 protein [Ginsengibacter sp.]